MRSRKIGDYIRTKADELELTAEFVLGRLSHMARASLDSFVEVDGAANRWWFDLGKANREGALGCVRRVRWRPRGVSSIEMVNTLQVLDLLAKIHGLYRNEPPRKGRGQTSSLDKINEFYERAKPVR